MKNKYFDTPILFIIFRRKDTASRVMEAIASVKPRILYISQDGARNFQEKKQILETRQAVLSKINWDCKLKTFFHEKNLGLKKHIPQALNIFFKENGYGIYLEDDTLPSKDFFYFQEKLLEKYKNDKRIFSINGTNFYPEITKTKDSYFLSKMGDIWGMGLWRRSWDLYKVDMNDFGALSKSEKYKSYFFSERYRYYLETFWKAIIKGRLDSWAMQIIYAAVKNDMYFINPGVNLVNNIGLGNEASNMSLQTYHKSFGKIFPLRHPKDLVYDKMKDILYFNKLLKGGWLRLWAIKIYLFLK